MAGSKHLDEIVELHNKITNAQIVAVDIEKYSRRRTQTQAAVVEAFTECLAAALQDVAREFITYAQQNDKNFSTDIISLPTGDGAFVAFTFDGLPDVHLFFARRLLAHIRELNTANDCERFQNDGWCNCHSSHRVRVGIGEGKSIVYGDVNGSYNIAGGPINLAARIMHLAEPGQVFLSDFAYEQLIDLVDNPELDDSFRTYPNVLVKHGLRVNVHQFVDLDDPAIDSSEPENLAITLKMEKLMETMGGPKIDLDSGDQLLQARRMLGAMEQVAEMNALWDKMSQGDFSHLTPPDPSS